eukprot:gene10788-3405_t
MSVLDKIKYFSQISEKTAKETSNIQRNPNPNGNALLEENTLQQPKSEKRSPLMDDNNSKKELQKDTTTKFQEDIKPQDVQKKIHQNGNKEIVESNNKYVQTQKCVPRDEIKEKLKIEFREKKVPLTPKSEPKKKVVSYSIPKFTQESKINSIQMDTEEFSSLDDFMENELHEDTINEIISDIVDDKEDLKYKNSFMKRSFDPPKDSTIQKKRFQEIKNESDQQIDNSMIKPKSTKEIPENSKEKKSPNLDDLNTKPQRRPSKINDRISQMENVIQKTRSESLIETRNSKYSMSKPLPSPTIKLKQKNSIIIPNRSLQSKLMEPSSLISSKKEDVTNKIVEGNKPTNEENLQILKQTEISTSTIKEKLAQRKFTSPIPAPSSPAPLIAEKHVITTGLVSTKTPTLRDKITNLFRFDSDSNISVSDDEDLKPMKRMRSPHSKKKSPLTPKLSNLLSKTSFDEILEKPILRGYFKKYLEKDFNESSLNFYEQVEKLHEIQKEKDNFFDDAMLILRRFIVPKSVEEIPIDKMERSIIFLQFKDIDSDQIEKKIPNDIFDDAQEKSKQYLQSNYFHSFLQSNEFIQYLFEQEDSFYFEGEFYSRKRYEPYFKESGITSSDLNDEKMSKEISKIIKMAEKKDSSENLVKRFSEMKEENRNSLNPTSVFGYYDTKNISELPLLDLKEDDIEMEDKTIKCVTIDKIIEYLTDRKKSDNDSLYTFMLCYRSFISSTELMNKLKMRYLTPYPISMMGNIEEQIEWIKSELIPIRLKTTQILKVWLEHHFYDFNDELIKCCEEFIKMMKLTNGKAFASSIETTLKKKKKSKSILNVKTEIIGYNQSMIPKQWESIFDWDAKEIAKQITFREYLIFRKIGPGECVNKAWSSKQKATKAPNILNLIEWFNLFSGYIATKVLESPNVKERAKNLSFAINLASEFKSLNNINGIYEVISSLNLASVHRLKQTWNLISQRDKTTYDELQQYVSNDQNFKFMRDQISICIPPLVPYLGLFLTDLTFIDEGNQDFVNDKINFTKVQRVSNIIRNLKTYQQTPYDIHLIECIQNHFDEIDFRLDEEDMYELSLLREPRIKK